MFKLTRKTYKRPLGALSLLSPCSCEFFWSKLFCNAYTNLQNKISLNLDIHLEPFNSIFVVSWTGYI